jgi:hypothetical protein
MLPDGARDKLLAEVNSARDRLVVTWLEDRGLRIGELCGLHLVDLHLRDDAACGECRSPHLHVCHRPGNPNYAEAKTKHPWQVEHGTVTGGLIKRVSHAMIHSYFDYITTEYPRGQARHGMLLVQLHGKNTGQPWAPVAARRMLRRHPRQSRSCQTPRVSTLLHLRRPRRRRGKPPDRPRRWRLGIGSDGRRNLRERRHPRPGLRYGAARGLG